MASGLTSIKYHSKLYKCQCKGQHESTILDYGLSQGTESPVKWATMSQQSSLPRYDIHRSYEWNYSHWPEPVDVVVPPMAGQWRFCGLPVESPLGVAAGPLLNGRWCLYYASLGFDVVTYKTVRSGQRDCYPLPNLVPVECRQLRGDEVEVRECSAMQGSWAVSFGMPSKSPEHWRADVEWTREQLAGNKLLCVSVVATVQDGWAIGDLADDYALCAKWAVESGADVVETNFSCPNVATCDGQLFQQPQEARIVAERVRDAIGDVPLIIKIGHVPTRDAAARLIDALSPYASALAMTNSIATTVIQSDGGRRFDGQVRGICGSAILDSSINQVAMFHELLSEYGTKLDLIGVGGAGSATGVRGYLVAGAHAVHLATAAMLNPRVALEIKGDW